MSDIEEIANKIDKLRGELHNLITQKDSLLDPEIIDVSQMLDVVLNKYNEIIRKNLNK